MASAHDLRRIALGLDGTIAAPHFDRTAFEVSRTYATPAADALTANIKLTPEDEDFKCMVAPEIFAAIPNRGAGRAGRRWILQRSI